MEQKTHDYREPCWGWSIEVLKKADGNRVLEVMGIGRGIKDGDIVLSLIGSYLVSGIKYETNPPDMWHATLTFAGNEQ